jgi:hypothetical protein
VGRARDDDAAGPHGFAQEVNGKRDRVGRRPTSSPGRFSRSGREASVGPFARSTHKEPCRRIDKMADLLFEGEEAVIHVMG